MPARSLFAILLMTSLMTSLGLEVGCAAAPGRPEAAQPVPLATLQQAVDAARADAAQRAGTPAASFEVISAATVTWPDGSLGCPQPDRVYPQALVPGYRIALRSAAGLLDYHASAAGGLLLCPAGRARNPLPNSSRS